MAECRCRVEIDINFTETSIPFMYKFEDISNFSTLRTEYFNRGKVFTSAGWARLLLFHPLWYALCMIEMIAHCQTIDLLSA